MREGLVLGGHCSTIHGALENFSGSKQRVDGCVPALCSIAALTRERRESRRIRVVQSWVGLQPLRVGVGKDGTATPADRCI